MSEEGYQKLVAELKHLESVERPKIVAAIAEARDKGDLSENAEYDAAKEAQGLLEMKINQLKATIGDAKIIDTSKLKTDTVQILSRVELKNVKTDCAGLVRKEGRRCSRNHYSTGKDLFGNYGYIILMYKAGPLWRACLI